jgi:C4-dicarboxylate-specific signal transduction histidine kinase
LTYLGWIGIWLLVAAAVVIVAEGVLAVVWGVALARRSRALSEALQKERSAIEADVQRLKAALEETQRLWKPYSRALRLLNHPLAIALLGSLSRRRAGR